MNADLKQKWSKLSVTDQRIYTGLIAFICISLIYSFLWLPSQTARTKLEASIQEKKAQLAQMKIYVEQIKQLQNAIKLSHSSQAGLKKAIEISANLHSIKPYITKVEQSQDNSVSISLTGIPFDLWVRWIASLQNEHHIRVDSCHVVRQNKNVQIDAELMAEQN